MTTETPPIPVFLISFNRGAILERAIASLGKMALATRVIVHDNGSTDPETLDVLDRLEKGNAEVVRAAAIHCADDLSLVNRTVRDFFSRNAPSPYVVSDCDIDIGVADPRALNLYLELLRLFPDAQCVGPMLRIRDVPPTYPLFNMMMNLHIGQFWRRRPSWVETVTAGRIAYLRSPIDTTFAVHREGEPFRRLKCGLRVYEPFDALHLDWYIQSSAEDAYSTTCNATIAHWNNSAERERHAGAPLQFLRYYVVRVGEDGSLNEVYEKVARDPAPLG